jgi:hypothetical protein
VFADRLIRDSKWHPYLLVAVVLLSRLPFLFDGYGHEEDSYGLVVNAWEMHSTGHYVASRFPGHPLQEYFYLLIWDQPAWLWNSLSTAFSVVAVLAFHHSVKRAGMNHAMEAALMLAFTPVFFLAGTYTIDYAWSLAFVMLSFSALVCRKFVWCGILLGLAVGCRITSGVFIIPWALLLYQRMDFALWRNWMLKIAVPSVIIGVLFYVPAYLNYGTSFFDYSDQFPYPPFTKIIYKASIGVFGLLGIAALAGVALKWITQRPKEAVNPPQLFSPQRLTWVILAVIILHIISYLRLPQKAGYMLPVVPFIILLVIMYVPRNTVRIATLCFLLAPFLFGMNITDDLRGSGATEAAIRFNISGQEISIDAARGPIFAEREKRRNKMAYVARVCDDLNANPKQQVLVCGWWYNELLIEQRDRNALANGMDRNGYIDFSKMNVLKFYATCEELQRDYSGYEIYYLPEQNLYNDQMFGQACTDSIAQPFPAQQKIKR